MEQTLEKYDLIKIDSGAVAQIATLSAFHLFVVRIPRTHHIITSRIWKRDMERTAEVEEKCRTNVALRAAIIPFMVKPFKIPFLTEKTMTTVVMRFAFSSIKFVRFAQLHNAWSTAVACACIADLVRICLLVTDNSLYYSDLKLNNLVFTEDGHLVLCDVGSLHRQDDADVGICRFEMLPDDFWKHHPEFKTLQEQIGAGEQVLPSDPDLYNKLQRAIKNFGSLPLMQHAALRIIDNTFLSGITREQMNILLSTGDKKDFSAWERFIIERPTLIEEGRADIRQLLRTMHQPSDIDLDVVRRAAIAAEYAFHRLSRRKNHVFEYLSLLNYSFLLRQAMFVTEDSLNTATREQPSSSLLKSKLLTASILLCYWFFLRNKLLSLCYDEKLFFYTLGRIMIYTDDEIDYPVTVIGYDWSVHDNERSTRETAAPGLYSLQFTNNSPHVHTAVTGKPYISLAEYADDYQISSAIMIAINRKYGEQSTAQVEQQCEQFCSLNPLISAEHRGLWSERFQICYPL